MDEPMHATPTADMELEQRLDAYARARLSITPDAAARMRERVMREAQLTLGGTTAGPRLTVVGRGSHSHTAGRTRARLRRGGALLLAAGLAAGVLAGTAAAAHPGGPLYRTQIWVEEMTLPADPAERAVAELRRLESRLAEIEAAALSGDKSAVAAAILAYGQIADEALTQAGTDASTLDRLRIALDRHLAVLLAVAATAPPQAQEAIGRNIDRAVEHNDATLDKIVARTPPPKATEGGSGTEGGANPGGANPGGAAGPAATPTPDVTKKPHPTPEPDAPPAAATPAPTPKPPDHPGGGKPSPKPSQGVGRAP
jgi:hypothetical protein